MNYDYFYGQSGELFSYFRIPKALFQDRRFRQLSTDARTLYGILLDRMSLSVKNGWLDEQGRVYIIYTVREVQESLCCAEHKAVKLFRELEDMDLIERKRRGLGRPSLIYVKDFSSGLPKAQVQNCPNSNSGAAESAVLEQPKPQANKTDKNKTEWNDPDPIYSEGIREQLEDYFYQALEVELLLRLCPDEEETIYQIVDLLVDTCSTKRKILRIAGDDKPTEVVRSRLKKLNADHIRFVLGCLAENTAPVRNMKQYLLAMEGKKVLLVDTDPQGSLTISMGWQQPDELPTTLSTLMQKAMNDQPIQPGEGVLHHAEGIDLIPANIELAGLEVALVNSMNREKMLKQVLDSAKREYDFILLDCMPSLGMLTINALAAADAALIPVQAQYLSAKGLEQLLQTVQKVRRQINPKLKIEGILLTMTDSRTNYGKQISNLIRQAYGKHLKVFEQTIPRSVRAAETSAAGKSIFQHDPKGKVAEAYQSLAKEVLADADRQRKLSSERAR